MDAIMHKGTFPPCPKSREDCELCVSYNNTWITDSSPPWRRRDGRLIEEDPITGLRYYEAKCRTCRMKWVCATAITTAHKETGDAPHPKWETPPVEITDHEDIPRYVA